MSSDDELSSNTSSSCDVESLQLAVEGEGSFNLIVQRYLVGSWKKEMLQSFFMSINSLCCCLLADDVLKKMIMSGHDLGKFK